VSLVLVDEAWDIKPAVVEDGLEPTLAERSSGQLVMFSTAHRRATGLVPLRRAGAFSRWAAPETSLLVEWSAPAGVELDDRDGWRAASPHWSPARERLLTAKLARVEQGDSEDPDEDDARESFRSQWLNTWPVRKLIARGHAVPLCDRLTWANLADIHAAPVADAPVTVAVEDWYGLGASAAAASVLADGRVLVWGGRFPTRAEAYAWAAYTTADRPESRLVVGASMSKADAGESVPGVEVSAANTTTTRGALPLLRSLVLAGGLAHSGELELLEQVATTRLLPSAAGGLTVAHTGVRHDLLKAAAWALADRAEPTESIPDWWVF
jgi:hypothetical protein